jgi:alkylation response protein AidB-like acyl-CoA dehydrogenase
MNGARVGIAAQSLGVAEAAFRVARRYAFTRKQFGMSIERLPAVAELVTDMKIHIEAARALTYETSHVCDLENNNLRVLEFNPPTDPAETKKRKELSRTLKRLNGMLTPMSKYYSSEMCIKVATDSIQVLGGSGYMKDYPSERYLRDARITTIYEGTSQLQIVAAVRGVCSGAFEKRVDEFEQANYTDGVLAELKTKLVEARQLVMKAIAFVKEKGTEYTDLHGRRLVDSAITIIVGHLFLGQATKNDRKNAVAKRFLDTRLPQLRADIDRVLSGDRTAIDEYATLAGPLPAQ